MFVSGITIRLDTADRPTAWTITTRPGFWVDVADCRCPTLRFDSKEHAREYAKHLALAIEDHREIPFDP